MREREREKNVCVSERERERMCVSVCERESVCVFVCEREFVYGEVSRLGTRSLPSCSAISLLAVLAMHCIASVL